MNICDWSPNPAAKFLPWAPINIMPIGDIQHPTDLERLRRTIDKALEKDCWFFGMGDYADFASPSNRQKLKTAGLYETAEEVIDAAATKLEDELLECLLPTKGRWLGLLEGHHYFQHLDGSTTDTRLAKALGCQFLGTSTMLRLTFRRDTSRASLSLVIWAHHGHGSSVSAGGALSKLQRQILPHFDADIYLMGHYHRLEAASLPRIGIRPKGLARMYNRTIKLVVTGSYLEGWKENSIYGGRSNGAYPEKQMLSPVALGSPWLTITPVHRETEDHFDIEVHI